MTSACDIAEGLLQRYKFMGSSFIGAASRDGRSLQGGFLPPATASQRVNCSPLVVAHISHAVKIRFCPSYLPSACRDHCYIHTRCLTKRAGGALSDATVMRFRIKPQGQGTRYGQTILCLSLFIT
jgi:hypothetical protein